MVLELLNISGARMHNHVITSKCVWLYRNSFGLTSVDGILEAVRDRVDFRIYRAHNTAGFGDGILVG